MTDRKDPLSVLRDHVIWGWAVYDSDLAEGIEDIFPNRAAADTHIAKNFDAEQREFVEVFPVLMWTNADDDERVRRLSENEIDALGEHPRLIARGQTHAERHHGPH